MANRKKRGHPPKANRGVWSKIRKFTRDIVFSKPIVKKTKTEKVKMKRSDISKKLHNKDNSKKMKTKTTTRRMSRGGGY